MGGLPRLVHGMPVAGALAGAHAAERRSTLVEELDPVLDALERLVHVGLQADQHADRVLVGAAADPIGVAVRVTDDLPALRLGRLGEATLVDEEGGLLLRTGDDPLGFVLGLLDDPLTLGVDPLGGTDFFRDCDA